MPRYVALLRGINVGGHRVKMDELRRRFASWKFANVATYIASGNVIFEAASDDAAVLETQIERRLTAALGYEVPTFLRTLPELETVAQRVPFAPADMTNDAWSRYVLFLRTKPPAALHRAIAELNCVTDEFSAQGREIHWLCRGKISDVTPAAKAFEKLLSAARIDGTLRNLNTVQTIVADYTPRDESKAVAGLPPARSDPSSRARRGRVQRSR